MPLAPKDGEPKTKDELIAKEGQVTAIMGEALGWVTRGAAQQFS